jgi:DNA primase
MDETQIRANETTVPLLHTHDPQATLDFYQSLGFEVTWKQFKPYLYLAFEWSGFELHFGSPPEGLDPADLVRERGADAFRQAAEGAIPLVEYMIRRVTRDVDTEDPEDRARGVQAGLPIVAGRLYASFGRAVREGHLEVISSDFEQLTGRAPTSLHAVLEAQGAPVAA